MADRSAVEGLPYRELVKLAQSVGITDVKMLMPANRLTLVEAVLTVQQEKADADKKSGFSLVALVRTLAVPAAAVATAAVASTEDGKQAVMKVWPSVAMFCEWCRPHTNCGAAASALVVCQTSRSFRMLHSPKKDVRAAGMLLLAFSGWSPLNEGYNWQSWELRLPRAQ